VPVAVAQCDVRTARREPWRHRSTGGGATTTATRRSLDAHRFQRASSARQAPTSPAAPGLGSAPPDPEPAGDHAAHRRGRLPRPRGRTRGARRRGRGRGARHRRGSGRSARAVGGAPGRRRGARHPYASDVHHGGDRAGSAGATRPPGDRHRGALAARRPRVRPGAARGRLGGGRLPAQGAARRRRSAAPGDRRGPRGRVHAGPEDRVRAPRGPATTDRVPAGRPHPARARGATAHGVGEGQRRHRA
jgi:hypothetical protein